MELIKIVLFTLILSFGIGSARAACTIIAEDPVIQQFYRTKGFEVDSEKGNFRAEFEVTCEAVDQQKDKFSTSEVHKTTTKLEVFNQYENQKVVYHTGSSEIKGGRVEKSFVVPCGDTKEEKAKLLEESLSAIKHIDCDDEE